MNNDNAQGFPDLNDISDRDSENVPFLCWATFTPYRMKELIAQGADVNAKDPNGRTALHYAAFYNNRKSAQWLLRAGADPKAKDKFGQTASDIASAWFEIDKQDDIHA